MYWLNFIKELRLFLSFRKVALENREVLEGKNLRVSPLGVVYTIFNVPNEISTAPEEAQQGWVFSQMKEISDIMVRVGLGEDAYPELVKLENNQSNAILVKFYPIYETLNLVKFTFNLAITIFLGWLILETLNNFEWIYSSILNFVEAISK